MESKKIMTINCFACKKEIEIDYSDVPDNLKTFYWICPNCKAEIKVSNPNYANTQEKSSARSELLKAMELPNNIRKLSEEERNNTLLTAITNTTKVLNEIQCIDSDYELSIRQIRTRENAINNIKAKDYLEAYYETLDFVENYGEDHNGIVFEKEKIEVSNLIKVIYNELKK